MYLLKATRLSVRRGTRLLLRRLEVELQPGRLYHLRGANGSGKSTLLQTLAGLHRPSGGQIDYRAPLYYLGHGLGLNPLLSARENLQFAARLYHDLALGPAAIAALLDRLQLAAVADRPCGQLSAGQQHRCQLARLWLDGPAGVWLLDEPFNALDDGAGAALARRCTLLLAAGHSLMLTNHGPLPLAGPRTEIDLCS